MGGPFYCRFLALIMSSINNNNNNSAFATSSKWTYVGETTPNGTWIPAPSQVEPKSALAPTPVRMEPKPWVPVATQPVAVRIEEPKPCVSTQASVPVTTITLTVKDLVSKAVSMGFTVDLQGQSGCWCDTESMEIAIDMRQVEQYHTLLSVGTTELLIGILAHEVGHGISHYMGLNPMDEVLAWKHATDLYGGTLPLNILLLRKEALKGYLKPHNGCEATYVAHIAEVLLSREYFKREEIARAERKPKQQLENQAKIADTRPTATSK